ncbi:hypothetical protein [Parachitinimonas caeni]|uniref:Uncharacterized protein n=1 Tax=Parachitinimonas caeni TaxID=3031301 RepID=A0ABT7DUU9_9NEIS|nr:hypothetical protein [Parachitinimonas caeni]MDK2123594.1 hypothetical protein [Parachitinimonas caeni]
MAHEDLDEGIKKEMCLIANQPIGILGGRPHDFTLGSAPGLPSTLLALLVPAEKTEQLLDFRLTKSARLYHNIAKPAWFLNRMPLPALLDDSGSRCKFAARTITWPSCPTHELDDDNRRRKNPPNRTDRRRCPAI